MASTLPIAISCGEPAGIGPEIAVKAWNALKDQVDLLWIGDPRHLPSGTIFAEVSSPEEAASIDAFPVLPLDLGKNCVPGQPDPNHATGIIQSIETAVDLAKSGKVSAICTAPIHKAALIDGADFAYPGHTEFLSALSDDAPVAMMLACDELKVVPATIHIPLADVPSSLTEDGLAETLLLTHKGLRDDFGIDRPRIAVAGLNPHAGENGKMGREELDLIDPLLSKLREDGLDLIGPLSADTMFHSEARQNYDAAVCMYHDQALIPIKTLDFSGGVNVTLGLPFIRTSPDHGTAFDIAGTGRADPRSMIAAIKMAHEMSHVRADR